MFRKSFSIALAMGCCGCLGFIRKFKRHRNQSGIKSSISQEPLLDETEDRDDDDDGGDGDGDDRSYNGDVTDTLSGDDGEVPIRAKRSEEILLLREEKDMICRQFPVKETHKVARAEDENGNKMVNEYIREYKIGSGSYGKVVLYRSCADGRHYAIKAFHKSHLQKLRVAPSETAMTDVLREVLIMKMLEHPNIVNLIEVIDDPESDHFYMV